MSTMNDLNKFRGKSGLKLNLGCGREVKSGFVNVDIAEREKKLDLACDLSMQFPFDNDSCQYIYSEHMIEHFEWLDGNNFLKNCHRCLQKGGTLRIVFPDFYKVFEAYLKKDYNFFECFRQGLNEEDYPYYSSVYENPEKIKKERKQNPPPAWHLSSAPEDRKKLSLRVRKFNYLIEYVDWFVHQFGEHKTLYDAESMIGILKDIGFSTVKQVEFLPGFDNNSPTRVNSSVYIEAVK